MINRVFNTESCINKFKLCHGDIYDYSLVNYINTKTKVKIICQNHGEFMQQPNSHISGKGCPQCNFENRRMTNSQFIKKATKTHGKKYTYPQLNFKVSRDKINIICQKHGEFSQVIYHHLYGDGCPKCQTSKGEEVIENALSKSCINYITQHSFPDLKYKRKLKFDFYLPNINTIIEFDGKQHYYPIFGENKLIDTQLKDQIKNNYCIKNNIKIIRISYLDDLPKYIQEIIQKIKWSIIK